MSTHINASWCTMFVCVCQPSVKPLKNVKITDSTQSQIKWLVAEENPRSFMSPGTAEEKISFHHLKQDKSLCFYLFNVVALASHWLINETQEGSSGTKECQSKAFDPLTFIHRARAEIQQRVIRVCMLLMGLGGPCWQSFGFQRVSSETVQHSLETFGMCLWHLPKDSYTNIHMTVN